MSSTLAVIGAIAPIGAIDVVYYHLYKFRLYERDESVAEELTHLVRQAAYIGIVAILAGGVRSASADAAMLALLALDFASSLLDVSLEHRSRASIGGLPRGEYVLHFLGTFGAAAAAVTYAFERRSLPIAPAPAWQSVGVLAGGGALFLLELGLFVRARARRRLAACCA
ncbi:MAG: hypothetical protein U0183_11020 [Polyangiaceae bacterium]